MINKSKRDATMCLVTDCLRKALYRNNRSERGYCKLHKALVHPALAVSDSTWIENHRATYPAGWVSNNAPHHGVKK